MAKALSPRKVLASLLVVAIALIGLGTSFSLARAAVTIQVTTTADTESVDGACSLREAITAANSNATSNECVHDGSSGLDTITFAIPSTDGGCAAPNVCTITLGALLPTIFDAVTINGSAQKITLSGNNATQVFENSSTLNLQNLTIANGSGKFFGAIQNFSTLNRTYAELSFRAAFARNLALENRDFSLHSKTCPEGLRDDMRKSYPV